MVRGGVTAVEFEGAAERILGIVPTPVIRREDEAQGGKVSEKFGLRYALTPETIELYRTLGNDLEAISGESSQN